MRATIRKYIQAEKSRREESGEAGFSLIELIVVVVILGVLAAVAIPVFLGLQGQAEQNAQDAVAANAASQAAAAFASDEVADPTVGAFAENLDDGGKYTIAIALGSAASGEEFGIDSFCVTVSGGASTASEAGPGCGGSSEATDGTAG